MSCCPDPYAVLMIRRDATMQEIRAAFRASIGKWHPDVAASPEAHRRSIEIVQAYRVLSRPERRSCPDRRRPGAAAPVDERRHHMRRGARSSGLARAVRAATLAWAVIAGLAVASTMVTERSAGQDGTESLSL